MAERVEWLWVDDGDAVPADDRGLAYGQGVFETMRAGGDGLLLESYHRDRLLRGCRALGIPFDTTDFDRWRASAAERGLLAAPSPGRFLKLTVTAGSGGRGYRPPATPRPRVITATAPLPPLPMPGETVRVRECAHAVQPPPGRQGLKTLERLDQVLASSELADDDFEGLMTDPSGAPLEGTRSNIFVLFGATLVTPPSSGLAVEGTLRRWLDANLPELGLQLLEQDLTGRLIRENGLLLGNSVMGLVNATELGGHSLPVSPYAAWLQARIGDWLGLV